MIGQTPLDTEEILATAARITTRFARSRLPTETGDSAYELRIDLVVPPGLEESIPAGLLTEAIQRVGTEILGGQRGSRSGTTVLIDVTVLWVCYRASNIACRAFLAEILSGQMSPRVVAVSSNGGEWRPYTYAREAMTS